MWKQFKVSLQFMGQFAASVPKTPEEIKGMLLNRMPKEKPEDATPVEELIEQVVEEVGADEEPLPGWATFKRNGNGLYYEGRCIRGHLKDAAQQLGNMVKGQGEITAFKAKFANRVYVVEDVIPLGKEAPDGTEMRFIQVMTRQGPRSTYKYIDYVDQPAMSFTLKLLEDKVITEDHIKMVFEYGAVHGMGQERSQGWGRYEYKIEELVGV
jgi:hypothetical protein